MMDKCPSWAAWATLIVGILYLLQDYNFGLTWWSVNWWTAMFLIMGLCYVTKNMK